eukprot:TRINITY_DN3501_c0_g1_i1.p1 TRINITY_DN3501_c0_g1~~TRINITY_DN3501_c0_g1_i1.p1  ORF type:complete len:529 (+),score=141.46 TRINITY_DN3501_c0_g1_i1:553-2139(+)
MDEMRARFPEQAAYADKTIASLSNHEIHERLQQEFPEFSDKLSDSEIYGFLMQFMGPQTTPEMLAIQEKLRKNDEMSKEERELKIKLKTDIAKEVGQLIPEIYDTPALQDDKDFDLPMSDPSVSTDMLESEQEPFHLLRSPEEYKEKLMKTAQTPEDEQLVERIMDKFTPELTPRIFSKQKYEVVDAATDINGAFSAESIGKYIKISQREQRKYLPEGWCGKLEEREFKHTNEGSLIFRKQTFDVISQLKTARECNFVEEKNKPILLHGDPGVGKSATLQQIVYWARKNNWLVINIKSGLKWVHSLGTIQKSKILPGCWDQPYLGVRFLSTILDAHSDKLKQIPLKTHFSLGKFNGKTLYDLCEYGAALHELSCEAVVHLRNELQRVIEFPVLITIDDYNILYNYNQVYRDPECKRFKPRKLRNRYLTLTHAFLDIHHNPKLINGAFVGATSCEFPFRHFPVPTNANPDKQCEWLTVPPFSIKETLTVFDHYEKTSFVAAKTSHSTREIIHQLCDGRGNEMAKYCRSL